MKMADRIRGHPTIGSCLLYVSSLLIAQSLSNVETIKFTIFTLLYDWLEGPKQLRIGLLSSCNISSVCPIKFSEGFSGFG